LIISMEVTSPGYATYALQAPVKGYMDIYWAFSIVYPLGFFLTWIKWLKFPPTSQRNILGFLLAFFGARVIHVIFWSVVLFLPRHDLAPYMYCSEFIGTMFFFTAFSLVVFHWADLYYQMQQDTAATNRFRPAFLVFNGILYGCEIGFVMLIGLSQHLKSGFETVAVQLVTTFNCLIYLLLAVAYVTYCIKFYSFLLEAKDRHKTQAVLTRLLNTTCWVAFFLVLRVVTQAVHLGLELRPPGAQPPLYILFPMWVYFSITYLLCEIVPSATLLYILHPSANMTNHQSRLLPEGFQGYIQDLSS